MLMLTKDKWKNRGNNANAIQYYCLQALMLRNAKAKQF